MSKAPSKKIFVLRGERIQSLESFYDEVQEVLGGGWKGFGRNLDAFCDLLRGGFGPFAPGEPIEVLWSNFGASAKFEDKKAVLRLLEEASNVEFRRG